MYCDWDGKFDLQLLSQSMYCDWVKLQVWSATSISVNVLWQGEMASLIATSISVSVLWLFDMASLIATSISVGILWLRWQVWSATSMSVNILWLRWQVWSGTAQSVYCDSLRWQVWFATSISVSISWLFEMASLISNFCLSQYTVTGWGGKFDQQLLPQSVYCDCLRWQVWLATSVSVSILWLFGMASLISSFCLSILWLFEMASLIGNFYLSILWLGEMTSLICNFYLSVAAHENVEADLSMRYTLLQGR